MWNRKLMAGGLAVLLASVCTVSMLAARPQDGDEPRGRRGKQGRGDGFHRAQMKAHMLGRVRDRLEVSDDEWVEIKPLLENVLKLKREAHPVGPGGKQMRRGRGGRGGGEGRGGWERRRRHHSEGDFDGPPDRDEFSDGDRPGKRPPSAVRQAHRALRASLRDEDATDDEIADNLAALRQARADAQAKLEAAEEDLKAFLNLREQAQLVAMGILL